MSRLKRPGDVSRNTPSVDTEAPTEETTATKAHVVRGLSLKFTGLTFTSGLITNMWQAAMSVTSTGMMGSAVPSPEIALSGLLVGAICVRWPRRIESLIVRSWAAKPIFHIDIDDGGDDVAPDGTAAS